MARAKTYNLSFAPVPQPCHLCGWPTIEGCGICELPCCAKCECDCADPMNEIEKYQGETHAILAKSVQ
jgi:hypothetical protein